MRVLITGVAGFIGSSLADRLLEQGHEVVGIDSFEDYYSLGIKESNLAQARISPEFKLVNSNILQLAAEDSDSAASSALVDLTNRADIIYHLAAQPGVRGSWGRTFATYVDNNVLATQLMLEAAKESGIERFIYGSSSSVYGDTDVFPMDEDAKCMPFSPYGVTKYAAENLCHLYGRNFSVPVVALRFFTVYGPRQRPDMAFNRFMRAVREGASIPVFGDGAQTRDFTFVSDIVDGLVAAMGASPGLILNLGGGSRVTLREALDVLAEVSGFKLNLEFVAKQAGDVPDTWASIERAKSEIGYAPRVSLREGLAAEWDWLARAEAG